MRKEYKIDDEFIKNLKKLAKEAVFGEDDEDAIVYDHCGGNVDDAYGMGQSDGEISMARDILAAIGVSYKDAQEEDGHGDHPDRPDA
jgi:hypothetical protein